MDALVDDLKIQIDEDDAHFLSERNWHVDPGGYIVAFTRPGGRKGKFLKLGLHCLINVTPDGVDTDHINGDKLDNRRANLRSVTRSQSCMNRGRFKNNASGATGVAWMKDRKEWVAYINTDKKRTYLGFFTDKDEAILARQAAEICCFGEFSRKASFSVNPHDMHS